MSQTLIDSEQYPEAEKISQLLNDATRVVIIQADNPDGDSLASALALEQIVGDLGKNPWLYCGVDIPSYLRHMPGWDRVTSELPGQFDLSIIVDTSADSLLETLNKSPQKSWVSSKPVIVIDHHHDAGETIGYATVMCNKPAVAASEVIYELAQQLDWPLNLQAKKCLAMAIMSDSLGLTTQGTTARSIMIISELVGGGVSIAELESARRELQRKSPDLVRYKGRLMERIEYHADDRVATVTIPWDEIEKYSPFYNPSILVMDEMRMTTGTAIAIAFKLYNDGHVTGKIRANYGFPIANDLAAAFGGGGHKYASGFKIQSGQQLADIKADCIKKATETPQCPQISYNISSMKLFNTATRSLDEIVLIATPKVTVYTCGPTVYDYAHIGHWFNYVRMDTLIRVLKLSGYQPEWVMNITDVGHLVSDADDGEDKLEKGALREGKTAWEVAEFYTADFLECMRLLDISPVNHLTKATDHIAEQIALIQTLEAKGYTYTIDDGVYFDTSKFEGYAAFARLDLDDLQAGARVAVNAQKRNPTDFAVWKFSPDNAQRDMEWDNPFGDGRKGFPGWHIECSAMAMKYLGDTLDIHTGGIDHIPIHHTNEIAQSEAATGKRFVNHWLHSNHVTVNGEKISKSLNNGVRLQEIIEKGFSAEVVRLHVLESHYRSQSKFSWESLEAAKNRLAAYQALADQRWQVSKAGVVDAVALEQAKQTILTALQNDLDTPRALMELSQLESAVDSGGINTVSNEAFGDLLTWLDSAFGLGLSNQTDINDEQQMLLAERREARNLKDWASSDRLRNQLAEQGISLKDRPNGVTTWARAA